MEQLNCTVVASNVSGHSPHLSYSSTDLIRVVVLFLCFLLGISGNIAVIIVRPNWQHLSSLSQSLMLNLALSDLLSLVTLPLWAYAILYGWTLDLVACKIIAYLVYCSVYASLLTVTVLSVQRYLLVVHLQRGIHQGVTWRLLVLLWLVAVILSIPALVVRQLSPDQHRAQCHEHFSSDAQRVAILLTEALTGFSTFSVMVYSYVGLYRKLKGAVFFNNPQTTRLIASITITILVMWVPYYITNVVAVAAIFLNERGLLKICDSIIAFIKPLTFVNSCLNPLFYMFTSNSMCTVCQKAAEAETRSPDPAAVIPGTVSIGADPQ